MTRVTRDRPDDLSGPQIHLIYAVPSDGVDRRLDVNGTIAESFGVAEGWLQSQAGGADLRLDTYHGLPDITFVRLPQTTAQIASHGDFDRDDIEALIRALRQDAPNKIDEVFYDGTGSIVCGSAPEPPGLLGHVPVIFLQGAPPGAPGCNTNPFASTGQHWGYLEMDEVHEIVHTLGFVPGCAPHATANGHVSDSNADLMYAGPLPWLTNEMVLDYGRDDYFQAHIPGCLDLANSAFLTLGGHQLPPDFATTPPTLPRVRFCVVPRLAGLSRARAVRALRTAGCSVGRISHRRSGAMYVVEQSAAPGSAHVEGFKVSLRLGRRR